MKKNSLKNNEKTAQKNEKIKETPQHFIVNCYSERLSSFSIFYNF